MPELPAGVDADVLQDVRRVEQCRTIFEVTHQKIEVWEVFCLVMLDRDATKATIEGLLAMKAAGREDEFNHGTLTLFEMLLKMRALYGKLVRSLRGFIAGIPIGSFGKDTMEMALGFIIASDRGRERAQQWIEDPDRFKQDAAGRLEDMISRVMNYQRALRDSLP